jgi:type VI secretion system protein ImpL
MAWEQTLAWSLMAIIGLWGAGTAVVCPQPHADCSVAEQARALVEHPSVSDYQLTALHALRNDAGRLLHDGRRARPGISALVWTIISSCSTPSCPGTAWQTSPDT